MLHSDRNGKTERIRDPIHDMIVFRAEEPLDMTAWSLLETPDVQRLRRIKQLGVSEFVYSCRALNSRDT